MVGGKTGSTTHPSRLPHSKRRGAPMPLRTDAAAPTPPCTAPLANSSKPACQPAALLTWERRAPAIPRRPHARRHQVIGADAHRQPRRPVANAAHTCTCGMKQGGDFKRGAPCSRMLQRQLLPRSNTQAHDARDPTARQQCRSTQSNLGRAQGHRAAGMCRMAAVQRRAVQRTRGLLLQRLCLPALCPAAGLGPALLLPPRTACCCGPPCQHAAQVLPAPKLA